MWTGTRYAKLNGDGSDFESTGVVYRGVTANKAQKSTVALEKSKGLKLQGRQVLEKVKEAKAELGLDDARASSMYKKSSVPSAPSTPSIQAALRGSIKGLTIVIEFPQGGTSAVPVSKIDDFLNKQNYSQSSTYRNNGSVRDYFADVSGGKVNYTNLVFQYTARNAKSYYDRVDGRTRGTHRELVVEALNALQLNATFMNSILNLTRNSNGDVAALNILYAGSPDWGWAKGLWPHSSTGINVITSNGVRFRRYQMTNIGAEMTLRTFVHENGHMLFDFPDLYDYTDNTRGAGNFCLMAHGGNNYNPVPPSPYLRKMAGWGERFLNDYGTGGTVIMPTANDIAAYRHATSLPNEYFMLEYIQKRGRYQYFPGNGLVIYHVDERGNNDYTGIGTASQHAMVSIESASGTVPGTTSGAQRDMFPYQGKNDFYHSSNTSSSLWNGRDSGFALWDIEGTGEFRYMTKVPKFKITEERLAVYDVNDIGSLHVKEWGNGQPFVNMGYMTIDYDLSELRVGTMYAVDNLSVAEGYMSNYSLTDMGSGVESFQLDGDRVAVKRHDGTLDVKEGLLLNAPWTTVATDVVKYEIRGTQIVVLDSNGVLKAKVGDVNSAWGLTVGNVQSFELGGGRVGVFHNWGTLSVWESGSGLRTVAQQISAFKMEWDRIAVQQHNGDVAVHEGPIDGVLNFVKVGQDVTSFQLSTDRIATHYDGLGLSVIEGPLRFRQETVATNVSSYQIKRNRIVDLDKNGTLTVREEPRYGSPSTVLWTGLH